MNRGVRLLADASSRRFAVGFSYAGEDRAVVAPVADS